MHIEGMRPEEFYPVFGVIIRRRRKKLGLTQAELAPLIGLSRASLANIENGRQKVLLHQVYNFADALEIEAVEDLLPRPPRERVNDEDSSLLPLPKEGLNPEQADQIRSLFRDPSPALKGEPEEEGR